MRSGTRVRLGILLAILAVVFALAEAWHRAVLKYVVDSGGDISCCCEENRVWSWSC